MAELVVLLRGDGTEADRRRTVDALERNTPDLETWFCDASAGDAGAALDAAVARPFQVLVIGSESAGGAVTDQLAWDVVTRAPAADVVLLEVGGAVGPEWRERLQSAAYADAVVATSSALPADMLTLHDRSDEHLLLPSGDFLRGAALGDPLWGCVYVRRDALNIASSTQWLANDRENGWPPRLEDVVLVPGLVHVLAPTVVAAATKRPPQDPEPTLTPAVRRALAEVEAAVEPLRVTVDLRCCALPMSGTQVQALNLVASLAADQALQLSVLGPVRAHESVSPHLEALPSSVTRHTVGRQIVPEPHVFHRPYQILAENEITDVVTSGVRLVVTHQDMILDRTPAYFPSRAEWRHHAATTALTFVAADEVVFFSEHARREAVRDGLVDDAKASVVPPGTDHVAGVGDDVVPPPLTGGLGPEGRPFVLVIGNAYIHKNRLFALRVNEEILRVHGWDGATVLAGGKPEAGSSSGDEARFLRANEEMGARVVDLPHVTDAERRWLYRHAALVLYPTLYEGFGLIPFEAAAAGTPCVYSSRSSVAEYLPAEGALLDLGDVPETARRLLTVLESAEAGEAIVRAIRLAGSELTWARTADSYVEIYRRAMTRPVGLSLVSGREVIVGVTSAMISSETERRVLLVLRRSAAARLLARTAIAAAVRVRRVVQRFSRVART